MKLNKGKFTYKDLAAGQTQVVDKIDVSARDLSLDQPVPFTVSLALNQIPIKIEGRFSAKTQAGQATVSVDQASAKTLAAMMPPGGPVTLTDGQFSLKVKADYNPGRPITAQGELTGKKVGLVGRDKKALLAGDDLGLVFDLIVDPKTQKADIKALKATLGKNHISAAGWASAKGCDLTIDLPGQELGLVNRFIPDPKAGIASGAAGLNLRINTSDFTQKVHFNLSAFTDDLVTAQNKELPPLDLKAALAGVVWLKKNQLDLDTLSLQGPGVNLAGSGKFSREWVNLTLKPINLDIAQVLALSPVKPPYKVAGRMSGNLNVKGKPTKPESLAVNGLIDLKKMRLEGPPFTAPVNFSGQMAVDKQTITKLALTGSIDKTNFELTGSGKNLTVKPDLVMNIKADKADFDKLIAPPKDKKEEKKEEKKKSGEPDAVNAPVNARGEIVFGQLNYGLAKLKNFKMGYQFKDNVLTLSHVSGLWTPAGNLAANLKLDLNKPGYEYQGLVSLVKAEMAPLASTFMKQGVGEFNGLGWLELKFKGAGVTFGSLVKHLTASLNMNVSDGRFKGNPLLKQAGGFLGIKELEDFKFSKMNGKFDLKDGLIKVTSDIAQKNLPVDLTGGIGLDGVADLAADLRIAPEIAKGQLASNILQLAPKDKQGRYKVPLKLTGPLDKLSVGLDEKKMAAYAAEKVKEKIGDAVKDKVGDAVKGVGGDAVKDLGKSLGGDAVKNLTGSLTGNQSPETTRKPADQTQTDKKQQTPEKQVEDVLKKLPLKNLFN